MKKLKQILSGIEGVEVRGSKEIEISGISSDSRTVAPGNLFIARQGKNFNGGDFIQRAIEAGAFAVIVDIYDPFLKVTQIVCREPQKIEAKIASRYYGKPSEKLFVIGITGTKGKTTTSYLIRHLLEGLGKKCGLIGTVETIVGEHHFRSHLTTHFPIENQKWLHEMVAKKCDSVVMEVSSHGLEQDRVDEIGFDIGLFTNLYPDHLDYHKTIENYAGSKAKLFKRLAGTAILNRDNPWSEFMQGGKRRIYFGLENPADVFAENLRFKPNGIEFTVDGVAFQSRLMGRFNVYNLLGAIAVGLEKGASLEKISSILSTFESVPGRLERVPNDLKVEVFIDFAHTKEALENVLKTLKEIAQGRIIVVYGCGGDRDKGRRTGMGFAAETYADLSIITSDNPRSEDPLDICQEILKGYQMPKKAIIEIDRKKAIEQAISMAEEGDIILIAGKGHEKTQTFAHQTISFDDFDVAKEALQMRRSSAILSPS